MLSFDPAAILFWFLVCPFIASWRRAGAKMTLVVHFVGMFVVLGTLISYRDMLVRGDLGTGYGFVGLAVVLLTVSCVMRYFQNKVLSNTVVMGIPELDPMGTCSRLVVQVRMRASDILATYSY